MTKSKYQIKVKQEKTKRHSQSHTTRNSAALLFIPFKIQYLRVINHLGGEKGRRRLTRNKRIVKPKPAKFLSNAS